MIKHVTNCGHSFICRKFDGDLCQTKEEALDKLMSRISSGKERVKVRGNIKLGKKVSSNMLTDIRINEYGKAIATTSPYLGDARPFSAVNVNKENQTIDHRPQMNKNRPSGPELRIKSANKLVKSLKAKPRK